MVSTASLNTGVSGNSGVVRQATVLFAISRLTDSSSQLSTLRAGTRSWIGGSPSSTHGLSPVGLLTTYRASLPAVHVPGGQEEVGGGLILENGGQFQRGPVARCTIVLHKGPDQPSSIASTTLVVLTFFRRTVGCAFMGRDL